MVRSWARSDQSSGCNSRLITEKLRALPLRTHDFKYAKCHVHSEKIWGKIILSCLRKTIAWGQIIRLPLGKWLLQVYVNPTVMS